MVNLTIFFLFYLFFLAKRQAGSSSEDEELGIVEVSGEAPIISTRKTLKKNESEALLNDKDDDIEPNHGFIPDQDSGMDFLIDGRRIGLFRGA